MGAIVCGADCATRAPTRGNLCEIAQCYAARMDRASPMEQMVSDPLQLALTRELRSGERLIWSAKPLIKVSKAGFGIWMFAIPWTAFSLFWVSMAMVGANEMAGDDGWLAYAFPLFGVPFVLIGLGMLASPFTSFWTAPKTMFAVTDERVLKLYLGRSLAVESVPADRIGLVNRHENSDGSGTLRIATRIGTDSDGDRHTEHFIIGEVDDVFAVAKHVEKLSGPAR